MRHALEFDDPAAVACAANARRCFLAAREASNDGQASTTHYHARQARVWFRKARVWDDRTLNGVERTLRLQRCDWDISKRS